MCGRYGLVVQGNDIRRMFGLAECDGRLLPPRYNIAPTQAVAVVRRGAQGAELAPMRWGLLPAWLKDPKDTPLLINARAEGVAEKPAFRNAFRRRRCLVPASGFYEWQARPGRAKQPYWIRRADGEPLAFAGLWETWRGGDGSEIDSAAIVTTEANALLRPIHSRMPVVVAPADFELWLSPEATPEELARLLAPPADDLLEAVPVSARVNSAADDDASLWAPAASGEPPEEEEEPPRQARLL